MKLRFEGKTAIITAVGFVGRNEFTYEKFLELKNQVLAKKAELLVMEISTVGGDVFTAMDIYNEVSKLEMPTQLVAGAVLASAGTVIGAAFKKRRPHTNTLTMLHRPRLSGTMTASDAMQAAELLTKNEPNFLDVYDKVLNLTREEISAKWQQDWWMSASEALALGYYNESPSGSAKPDKVNLEGLHVPENYLSILNQIEIMKTNPMLIAAFSKAGVTIAADADEAALIAASESLANAVVTANAKLAELQATVTEMNTKLQAASKDKAKALVAAAVSSGKITADQSASYESLAEKDYEATSKILNAIAPTAVTEKTIADVLAAVKGVGVTASAEKDFGWYQKNDPKYLETLRNTNPEEFGKLKAEYTAKLR